MCLKQSDSRIVMVNNNYTIEHAVHDYLRWFKLHRQSIQRTSYLIEAHILPVLGQIEVSELTTIQIRAWQENLVKTPKRKRTGKSQKEQEYLPLDDSEEATRKRKVTANRILNTLKAILNKAYYDGCVESNEAWRRVRPFRKVNKPRTEYLDLEEVSCLVAVATPDLRALICGALYTGCRYGELIKMRVGDLRREIMKVYVRPSKNGADRYVVLTEEGTEFFEQQCIRKHPEELIFVRNDGLPWGRSHQQRRLKEAVQKAGIQKNISFHTLRHTHASQLAMRGVTMQVIARQLGHADARMAERHYAHMASDYVSDVIRRNSPKLGIFSRNDSNEI